MGIEHELLQDVGFTLGEVQIRQPLHRADERCRISCQFEREIIGAGFDSPRPTVDEGQGEEADGHCHESQKWHTGDIGRPP
jgi:hypothetical protein